jgi:hypothetical protein
MTARWKLNRNILKRAQSELPRLAFKLKLVNPDGTRPFIHDLRRKK